MRPTRLVGTAASLIILAAGLSACQDPNDPSPENTPALAGPPKQVAHRAAVRQHKMTRPQVVKALAAGPAKRRFAHIDLELRTRAITVTGSGDMAYSPSNPAFELELAGSCLCADHLDMVIANRQMFFHIPGMTEGSYTRIDPEKSQGLFARGFGRISKELDPLSALLAMRPGFRKVHYTGRSSLYGHPMSTYTLAVDSHVGLGARGLPVPAGAARKLIYHLWFDKHRMLDKITLDWGGLRMNAEMSDWGEPVHIRPPSPRQLVGPGGLASPKAA
jgi:hypothetical protein